MLKILLSSLVFLTVFSTIYSLKVRTLEGNELDFGEHKGKKILIVNTATRGRFAERQLRELEQLSQLYKDSLVVVAVPSNSFGAEPAAGDSLKTMLRSTYGAHYLIVEKMEVSGPGQAPLYRWLTQKGENGVMNSKVAGDFQKYLVGSDGRLMGYFIPEVNPLDSLVLNALEGQWRR